MVNEKKSLSVCITLDCNNRCKFCFQWDRRRKYKSPSLDSIKKILERNKGVADEVGFGGGEPTLLGKDLFKLLETAQELGYKNVSMASNGRMFAYSSFAKKFSKFKKFVNVGISIHGGSARTHDLLTGSKGSFEQTLEGIKNLIRYGLCPSCRIVITKQNLPELSEAVALLREEGIKRVTLAYPKIEGGALVNFDEVVPSLGEAVQEIKNAIEIGDRIGIYVEVKNIPFCLLEGHEGRIADIGGYLMLRTPYLNFDGRPEELLEFTKFDFCNSCVWDKRCHGAWKKYVEKYGADEFKQVGKKT